MSRWHRRATSALMAVALVASFIPTAPAVAVLETDSARVVVGHRTPTFELPPAEQPLDRATAEAPVSVLATTTIASSGVTTLAANTVWTTANNPVILRNDLVVPAGKTLTVQPGVKVYFDTVDSGQGSAGTTANPSAKIDLIVHGKIVAKGTSTEPILFTSINSLPASATVSGLPTMNSWGRIFTDSMAASELSYCTFEFGDSIVGQGTARPYVKNCSVVSMNGSAGGAITFENPKTDATTPRPVVENCEIRCWNGIFLRWRVGNGDSGDRVLDPYLVGNQLQGCGIELRMDHSGTPAAYGNMIIKGAIARNEIHTTGDEPVILHTESDKGKTCSILTAFSGNTFTNDDDNCVAAYAAAEETGSAIIAPTFSGDRLTPWNHSFDARAYVEGGDPANRGAAEIRPVFNNCTLATAQDDGVYLYANNLGGGVTKVAPVFNGGTIDNVHNAAVWAQALGNYGPSYVTPVFNNVTATCGKGSDYFLSAMVQSQQTGSSYCNPVINGGSMQAAAGRILYLLAYAVNGTAECRPAITGASLRSPDWPISASAHADALGAGNHSAVMGGTIKNTTVIAPSSSAAFYGRAVSDGTGNATVNTAFSASSFTAEDAYGVETYALANAGAAKNQTTLTGCTVAGQGVGLVAQAVRQPSVASSGTALAAPVVSGGSFTSKYSDAVRAEATNSEGFTKSAPVISGARLTSALQGRGLWCNSVLGASSAGRAETSPMVTSSTMKADSAGVELGAIADGSGSSSKVGGTFTGCAISSYRDTAFSGVAENSAGSCEAAPAITDCTVSSATGYGINCEAAGQGGLSDVVRSAPTITRGSVSANRSGVYAHAGANSTNSSETVLVEPKITSARVYSSNAFGVEVDAASGGTGTAKANALVQSSPVKGDSAIQCSAHNYGAGDAVNTSRVLGASSTSKTMVEAPSGTGVKFFVQAMGGLAKDQGQAKNLTIASLHKALQLQAYGAGAGADAQELSIVSGIKIDTKWEMDDDVCVVTSDALDQALLAPTVAGISSPWSYRRGIVLGCNGAQATTISPVVTGNTLAMVNQVPITIQARQGSYTSGGADAGADSAPLVTKNVITDSADTAIRIIDIPAGRVEQNKIRRPGAAAYISGTPWEDAAGICWSNPTASALVRGNSITEARMAVAYLSGAPTTQYNSFGDCYGRTDRPFNYWTEASSAATPTPAYDARYNWWGTTSPALIGQTIATPYFSGPTTMVVDYSSPLPSCAPKVSSVGVSKTSTKVKLTVKFDRPMDVSITTLKFGKSSPYATYGVTGSWSMDGKTWTGTRTRAGLPTGVNLYLSGAKDLPGNAMLSTSKAFKL